MAKIDEYLEEILKRDGSDLHFMAGDPPRIRQYGKLAPLRAEADKKQVVIIADARRQGQILRGEGDAEATRIYNEAYGQDAEFFDFYRSMQAYAKSLGGAATTLVLDPAWEFFKYFSREPREGLPNSGTPSGQPPAGTSPAPGAAAPSAAEAAPAADAPFCGTAERAGAGVSGCSRGRQALRARSSPPSHAEDPIRTPAA